MLRAVVLPLGEPMHAAAYVSTVTRLVHRARTSFQTGIDLLIFQQQVFRFVQWSEADRP